MRTYQQFFMFLSILCNLVQQLSYECKLDLG
jgi:hypothetical protein